MIEQGLLGVVGVVAGVEAVACLGVGVVACLYMRVGKCGGCAEVYAGPFHVAVREARHHFTAGGGRDLL